MVEGCSTDGADYEDDDGGGGDGKRNVDCEDEGDDDASDGRESFRWAGWM